MATTTTKAISEAVKAIPAKKESLRKAFDQLKSLSGSLSSFTLKWEDLENHFSSLQSSIDLRLKQLQSLENSTSSPSLPKPSATPAEPEATPRPELVELCTNMNGSGLRIFLTENRKDIQTLRPEIAPAIRAAPNPAKLVLDAISGFYNGKPAGSKDSELNFNRRTCILILELLCLVKPEIEADIVDEALTMAREWKERIGGVGDTSLQAWGFLQLIAAYGIAKEFNVDELMDVIVPISKRKPIIDVCNAMGIAEHIPTLVEKLISKGKQLEAVKFIYAYELVEKFPPVPLIKDFLKESKKNAQEVRKKGNNSAQARNEATAKEISALRAVIKVINEYKLESEYSTEPLQVQVDKLEKMKPEKKRTATSGSLPKMQSQQDTHKRARASFGGPFSAAAPYNPPVPSLLNQTQPYMADRASFPRSAGGYGVSGVVGLYDRAGSGLLEPSGVPSTKLSSTESYLYPPESQLSSGPYERPFAYDRPVPYDMPATYDRQSLFDRPSGYGNYSLSGGLP